jgi:cytochrome c oxidase assembly factor CtaG
VHQPSPESAAAAPLDAQAVLAAWSVEPALVLGLGAAALVYARGRRVLARRRAAGVERWRAGAFLAGLASLFLALASPLDTLSDRFLAVHMAQHLVLLAVVPPLLLLGAPLLPLLAGLPVRRVRRAAARAAVRVVQRLGHPLLCWIAMALVTWAWHVPAAFELALSRRPWHVAEHATFLAAGLLFWTPVVRPWPYRPRWPDWAMIPYLLLADVQNTALAALLCFSDRVFYPSYGTGAAALEQQVVAGVLMWVPMSLVYLVPAAVLTLRWLSPAAPLEDIPWPSPRSPATRPRRTSWSTWPVSNASTTRARRTSTTPRSG